MNALEMLLRRISDTSGGGSVFDRLRGTDLGAGSGLMGSAQLQELTGNLPDELIHVPGQGGWRERLHPNALGVFGPESRPQPAGDVVLPSGGGRYPAVAMPRRGNTSGLPMGGFTQISAGQGLLPPQGIPSPEALAALAARQRNWEAQQDSPVYGEGEVMGPNPTQTMGELGERTLPLDSPQRRENALFGGRDALLDMGNWPVLREGEYISNQPLGQSPFASPLNQLMQLGRRAPLSMY